MRSIVGWSLRFPVLAIAIAAALILVGVINLRRMPLDVLPEFAPPFVEVQTEAPGLSASEVEAMLTVPLEAPVGAGTADHPDRVAERVPTAGDAAAAVGDKSGRVRRAFFGQPLADRPVGARPLADQARVDGRTRCRERGDLGPAGAAAAGAGRPGAHERSRRFARRRHPGQWRRALGLAADLPERLLSRSRWLDRHPPTAHRGAACAADLDAGGAGQGRRQGQGWRARSAR